MEITGKMTAEEQKRMDALEAENAKLRGENSELQDKLLAAQKTLAKYAQMLFGQKTERTRLPEKPEELTGSLFVQEMDPQEQAAWTKRRQRPSPSRKNSFMSRLMTARPASPSTPASST